MSADTSAAPLTNLDDQMLQGSRQHKSSQTAPLRRVPTPSRTSTPSVWDRSPAWQSAPFFQSLPPGAIQELQALAHPLQCQSRTRICSEAQHPGSVFILLYGDVRLFLHSTRGRRLTLGTVRCGDILGLNAALSGNPSRVTAEAQSRCLLASVPTLVFLDFLNRHPDAGLWVRQQLNDDFLRACQQLRLLSLTLTAPEKIASLFLAWSQQQPAPDGIKRVHCTMTHEEIGEYIGVSRGTVCRTLADLKHRRMLEQHGSLFLITDITALQHQAGTSTQEPLYP